MGDIKVRFFPKQAPKAVENFLTHAKDCYYDGVIFHTVRNDFIIKGGDPSGKGTGGESIWDEPFEAEITADLRHIRGALCMDKTNQPISIGSQFFIVQSKQIDKQVKERFQYAIDNLDDEMDYWLKQRVKDTIFYQSDKTIDMSAAKYKDFYPAPLMEEYINNGGYSSLDFKYTVFGQVYEGMDIVDKIAVIRTDDNYKPKKDVIINKIDVAEY